MLGITPYDQYNNFPWIIEDPYYATGIEVKI